MSVGPALRLLMGAAGLLGGTLAAARLPAESPAADPALTATVIRVDGTSETGSWVGIRNGRVLLSGEDSTRFVPLGDTQRLAFHAPRTHDSVPSRYTDRPPRTRNGSPQNRPSDGPSTRRTTRDSANEPRPDATSEGGSTLLYLADHSRLTARAVRGDEEGLIADTILGEGVVFPLERLAGVLLTDDPAWAVGRRLFDDALLNRRPAEDVLISRDAEDPKVLRGRIERFGSTDVTFRFGGQSRSAPLDRLLGIVFATGGSTPSTSPATVELVDGSTIGGRVLDADDAFLRWEAFVGGTVVLPIAAVRAIAVRNDRILFLSDLPITREHREGQLHRPWPVRLDENLRGEPMFIGGRAFERGISCHSKTELTYTLNEPFVAFAATIGMDDGVRPRGSAVFRVIGSGKTLYDSGLVTGSDEPRDVFVDVSGVTEFTLVVDYGEGLDLADHAIWGGARLIRPARNEPGVQ